MVGKPGQDAELAAVPGAAPPVTSWPDRPLRHTYSLAWRDVGLLQACILFRTSSPYAGRRLAWLLLYSAATLCWLAVMVGGSTWLSARGDRLTASLWCIACLLAHLLVWRKYLRPALFWVACGHVAVLTELITTGAIHNNRLSMLTYGSRLLTRRFREISVLFALHVEIRRVMQSFHASLRWVDDVLPRPWLIGNGLRHLLLRSATHYLDLAVLSYDFARQDADPVRATCDGLIYYCQSAKPMLKTAAGVAVLDVGVTALSWGVIAAGGSLARLFWPAAADAVSVSIVFIVAALLTAALRASLLKPTLLAIVLARFHTLAEGQVINPAWVDRLCQLSHAFRTFWRP